MLTDESDRCCRYPGIAFRGSDHQRRPWVIGTPFDVWEVVQAWQDLNEDPDRTRERCDLSAHQLRLALAYYREFADEVDDALRLGRRPLVELEATYPFVEVLRVADE